MNAAVYVNFLRHLLFLFIILELIACVIQIRQATKSHENFEKRKLVNYNVPRELRAALFQVGDLLHRMIFGFCMGLIVYTIWAFLGAVFLHSYPMINFAAGLNFLCSMPVQFLMAADMSALAKSFRLVLSDTLKARFMAVNAMDPKKFLGGAGLTGLIEDGTNLKNDMKSTNYFNKLTYTHSLNDRGWCPTLTGTILDQLIIDYIQMTYRCCGFTGRLSWNVRIPESCCPEEYQGDNCILVYAYKKGCVSQFNIFRNGLIGLQAWSIFISFLGIGIITCSMILAKYKVKYPNEEYNSETSSSESENSSDY